MNKKLELKLVKKYPSLYRDYGGDPRYTCMAWGFTCEDGWYDIIDDLSHNINIISKKYNIDITVNQVKEKFAVLRYYYHINKNVNWFYELIYNIRLFLCKRGFYKQVNIISNLRKKIYRTASEKIFDLVREAEILSSKTCEICGNKGRTIGKQWLKTLCYVCDEKYIR